MASYPFAYTFARLSSRNPESGGIPTHSPRRHWPGAGAVVAWLFIAWVVAGAPAIGLAAADYVVSSVPMTRPETFVAAAALLLAAGAVNYRGIRLSGKVQFATVAVIVVMLSWSSRPLPGAWKPRTSRRCLPAGVHPSASRPAASSADPPGYENVSNVAEEFKDPKRDFNRSVAISVVLVTSSTWRSRSSSSGPGRTGSGAASSRSPS